MEARIAAAHAYVREMTHDNAAPAANKLINPEG
jgi:hypothetical protein